MSKCKVLYTSMLDNRWTGSCFQAVDAALPDETPQVQEQRLRDQGERLGEKPTAAPGAGPRRRIRFQHKHFQWNPDFTDVWKSVEASGPGNDGRAVREGMTRYVCILDPVSYSSLYWSVADSLRSVLPLSRPPSCVHQESKAKLICEWTHLTSGSASKQVQLDHERVALFDLRP